MSPMDDKTRNGDSLDNRIEREDASSADNPSGEDTASDKRTKTFLYQITHELRTPLTTVIGFAQMIEEERLGPVGAPQYREYASLIGRSGKDILENLDAHVSREQFSKLDNLEGQEHIMELSPDMICICRGGKIERINAAGIALLGASDEETLIDHPFEKFVHRDYQHLFSDGFAVLIEESQALLMKFVRCDGRVIDVRLTTLPYNAENSNPAVILMARDITERQRAMQKWIDHDEQIRKIMETVEDGIVMIDAAGNIEAMNPAGERAFGYDVGEMLNMHFPSLIRTAQKPSGSAPASNMSEFARSLSGLRGFDTAGVIDTGIVGTRKDGSVFPVDISINETTLGGRQVFIGSFRDVTEDQEQSRKLHLLATRDRLTALPNRYQFSVDLKNAIEEAAGLSHNIGILNIDLNSFKNINDALGHVFGNKVIKAVGLRLHESFKHCGILTHFGSDDFFAIVKGNPSRNDLKEISARVCEEVSRPLVIDEKEIVTTCTIGICMYPEDGQGITDIMKHSDNALHHAKSSAPGSFVFYERKLGEKVNRELEIERNLRRAIERDELHLLYQPKVDLRSREVTGCEALLRWESPDLGFVPPDEFIAIAERTRLIVDLGQWVLNTACQQARAWRDSGIENIRIGVNVSAVQFIQGHIKEQISSAIFQTGFDARFLDIELTESMLIQDPGQTIEILNEIRKFGLTVSMDDFGTGYSSLSYLARLPLDNLKVDRSFVMSIPDERNAETLVRTIVTMARELDLCVVAEGIETENQKSFLTSLGCEMGQGYLFGKPLTARELETLVSATSNPN